MYTDKSDSEWELHSEQEGVESFIDLSDLPDFCEFPDGPDLCECEYVDDLSVGEAHDDVTNFSSADDVACSSKSDEVHGGIENIHGSALSNELGCVPPSEVVVTGADPSQVMFIESVVDVGSHSCALGSS